MTMTAVVGLVIRQNQQELNVRARQGVILCAGGFVMNEDMLRKYAPMLTAGNTPSATRATPAPAS